MPAKLTYNTQLSQSEIISKSAAHLKAVGYKVKTKGLIVKAKNGRDYTTWVAVVLFLFMFIPFLIYWFTRKKNKLVVDATKERTVTINYDGRKAILEAEKLGNMFQG